MQGASAVTSETIRPMTVLRVASPADDIAEVLIDEQAIAWRFGAEFGSLLYSQWYDLEPNTHDLDIDIKDLQKVFGRDGSSCQNPFPAQTPVAPPQPLN